MNEISNESYPLAIDYYNCMASDFILSGEIDFSGYSLDELMIIAKAKKNKFKIIKGQRYIRKEIKRNELLYIFNAIPEMHGICLEHKLYNF